MKTDHLRRIAETLTLAIEQLRPLDESDEMYDVFRNAATRSFDLGIESAGKALRRALRDYIGSSRSVNALSFNDVLRSAGVHALLSETEVERWLLYRENRNVTAHDYGESFVNETLRLLPTFAVDLVALADRLDG